MALLLLIAFIAVPLIEIGVFIQLGGLLGLWPTLTLVILTAFLGTWQLRAQGLATLNRARGHMDRGVLPTRELFDGLCLLVAGALLLTPGFVTDGVGFLLFLGPVRDLLRVWLGRWKREGGRARMWVKGDDARPGPGGGGPGGGGPPRPRGKPGEPGPAIDADYRDVTPEDGEEPGGGENGGSKNGGRLSG